MTRAIVIWKPGFHDPCEVRSTIDALFTSWRAVAPYLLKRRTVAVLVTTDVKLLALLAEWMRARNMNPRVADSWTSGARVITIEDPLWENDEPRWKEAAERMRAGAAQAVKLLKSEGRQGAALGVDSLYECFEITMKGERP